MIYHVAGNEDQPVKRFQIPLVPGLTSTIHVAQGTGREMRTRIRAHAFGSSWTRGKELRRVTE